MVTKPGLVQGSAHLTPPVADAATSKDVSFAPPSATPLAKPYGAMPARVSGGGGLNPHELDGLLERLMERIGEQRAVGGKPGALDSLEVADCLTALSLLSGRRVQGEGE